MTTASGKGVAAGGSPTRDEVAERVAAEYLEIDSGITRVFRIIDSARECAAGEPIKLLTVYEDAIPSGVILPIAFPPHPSSGMYFPTEVVQIAPEELERVQTRQLPLPEGWSIDREYLRHDSLTPGPA